MARILSSFVVSLSMLSSACVVTPTTTTDGNTSGIAAKGQVELAGYAEQPGAFVAVEAYHPGEDAWFVVADTTSSARAVHFGGYDLYDWKVTVDLRDDLTTGGVYDSCYLAPESDCLLSNKPAVDNVLRLRMSEKGGTMPYLYTFEEGGFDCVIDEVLGGLNLVSAGSVCVADTEVITIDFTN